MARGGDPRRRLGALSRRCLPRPWRPSLRRLRHPPGRPPLAAAVLPGTGREPAYRLRKEADSQGYAVETGNGGEVIGHLALFDENLVAALHVADSLLRSPLCLAGLLEAGGQVILERSGAILDARVHV